MIAVIEDDITIRSELIAFLNNSGYEAIEITDYANAADIIIKTCADLVLMDVNLPDANGMVLCRELRRKTQIPVIFVTACNTSMDELNCLLSGGDDYISKPFQPPVLLARVAAVLKRSGYRKTNDGIHYEHNGVSFDAASATLRKNSVSAELTKNELKICCCLFMHPDEIVTRSALIDFLWDNGVYIEDNLLSVHITRLRAKLREIGAEDFIETKRGLGYKI